MSGRLLMGPFLTRAAAADRAGLPAATLPYRPDLLRIGGRMLPEAYFGFQFGRAGIRADVGSVVLALRGSFDDLTIAGWLVTSNTALRGEAPLAWIVRGGPTAAVVAAATTNGPQVDVPATAPASLSSAGVQRSGAAPSRHRTARVRHGFGRPAASQ